MPDGMASYNVIVAGAEVLAGPVARVDGRVPIPLSCPHVTGSRTPTYSPSTLLHHDRNTRVH